MEERIASLRERLAVPAQPTPSVKFVVVMHHFEFMRASNTGKILLRTFPNT
jgi:DTW domain-containing protein YfiP